MHEIDLALEILALAKEQTERLGGGRVERVEVRVGELSCVAPEALAFAFDEARRGTPFADTHLDIVAVPASGSCPDHGTVRLLLGGGLVCPECGRGVDEILSGDELVLEALEIGPWQPPDPSQPPDKETPWP